jgi:AP endonuclease-2
VAIYTRNATCAPIRAEEGITGCLSAPRINTSFRDLPKDQQIGGYPHPGQLAGLVDEATLDSEGRCVILEFVGFVLLGVYSPANTDESRDDFRLSYLQALDARVRNLVAAGKQVILTGDLNVTGSGLDTSNLADRLRKTGISFDEWASAPSRRIFNQLIYAGNVSGDRDKGREQPVLWDLCRLFHPTREGMNTCWDTKKNTRPANFGSRIDYILCSDGLKNWFTYSDVQQGLMGSDHCPVYATIRDIVTVDGTETHVLDLLNPAGMVENGHRRRELGQKDLLALSARLIPEFDRRQSIRDMFTKNVAVSSSPLTSPSGPVSPGIEGSEANSRGLQARFGNSTTGNKTTTDHVPSPGRPIASKRYAAAPELSSQSNKRPKQSAQTSERSKEKPSTGQMTLQGFFKPKAVELASVEENQEPAPKVSLSPASPKNHQQSASRPLALKHTPLAETDAHEIPVLDADQKVFDPIQAKESWSKLLGKRVVPRCEHDEPCLSLVTKKPGINCG